MKEKKEELAKEHNWKNKNQEYLYELQKLLDLIDNINDESLKISIRNQIIRFDRCLTKLAEEMVEE